MTSISITELLTIIFVLVDDWYQIHGRKLLNGKVGQKPIFKDSEVISLVLAHDFIPYPAETQYVEFIRANYLALFPKLVDQSSSIDERVPYVYWWSSCGGFGLYKKAGICRVVT